MIYWYSINDDYLYHIIIANLKQAVDARLQQYSYVWIIPGTYEEDWLRENITQTNFDYECLHSIGEIETFVHEQRTIAINHYPSPIRNDCDSEVSVLMLVETLCIHTCIVLYEGWTVSFDSYHRTFCQVLVALD